MTLGLTTARIGSLTASIFDRERTVIDAFRFLSSEIAIKALQAYLRRSEKHSPDLGKLRHYAKLLRVNIGPYLMALAA
jgi:hypothetical protein